MYIGKVLNCALTSFQVLFRLSFSKLVVGFTSKRALPRCKLLNNSAKSCLLVLASPTSFHLFYVNANHNRKFYETKAPITSRNSSTKK